MRTYARVRDIDPGSLVNITNHGDIQKCHRAAVRAGLQRGEVSDLGRNPIYSFWQLGDSDPDFDIVVVPTGSGELLHDIAAEMIFS